MEISEIYNIYKKNPIICTDTRKTKKGGVFFALKGERFNGNKFANQAINDGCDVAIIDEKKY
ncbi:MAG: Mur ligase domain-containing protein, partial [Bacteroidota bacterium]|nr:Mur ligase domain-containing protein [Bacteroidota bacterium]